MAQKAILTRALVDQCEAPSTGETWIADTKQRGFGLRIRADNAGGAIKSYCVRTVDREARARRSTFDTFVADANFRRRNWWRHIADEYKEPTLGDHLEDARAWAYDEIARLRGKPTLDEEEREQRERAKIRIEKLRFSDAAQHVLKGMQFRGASEQYRVLLDKLFWRVTAPEIALKPVYRVTLDDVACMLDNSALKPGNRATLRPFLGQILDIPERFGVRSATSSYFFRELSAPSRRGHRTQQLSTWSKQRLQGFLDALEQHDSHWQQALCLRIYFEVYGPLSRLMAARWSDVGVVRTSANELLGAPDGSHLRWTYKPGRRGWDSLRGQADRVVEKCFYYQRRDFPNSAFLFPTFHGRKVHHIRSIDHVWRRALNSADLSYVSPCEFRKYFQERFPWRGFSWEWKSSEWWSI